MAAPIDFYFDFSSPYGYFGSEQIDKLAGRYSREVEWHPILLGAVFKVTGGAPLPSLPLKGEYGMRDIVRSARFMQIPYRHPSVFPIASQSAVRGFYWLDGRNRKLAKDYAQACYRAFMVEDINISDNERLIEIATSLGIDRDAFSAAINDAGVKERARQETDEAIKRGVFGSPFFIVDGEPFWGVDRLPQVEKWLETGGF